jgi:hypothetical protein
VFTGPGFSKYLVEACIVETSLVLCSSKTLRLTKFIFLHTNFYISQVADNPPDNIPIQYGSTAILTRGIHHDTESWLNRSSS